MDRNIDKKTEPLFGRAMSAFTWRFVSESLRFVLQLTVMIILARLVKVDQFGLLALAMVGANLVIRISEIGIYYAVVQRKDLTDNHIRVAFTLSTLFGLFFTAVVYLTAPLAGALLRNDEVTPILRLMSVIFLFMNLGSTAMGLLQRKLDYRNLLIAELCSYGIGYALVSVALALLGYGAWALAWASVIQFFLRTVLLLWLSPHPKRPSLAPQEARQLLNFGVGSSLSTLANYAAINGDYFVVGRWLGATALGLYSRAYQLMTLPMMQFTSVIASVLFPVYSMIQDEDARLRRAYLNSVSLSAVIVAPSLATLGVAAPEIMIGIFGAEWAGAAAPLAILCAGGSLNAAYTLGDSLARAKGAVYAKSRCHAIYAVCVFTGSYIGAKWGIIWVAVGVVIATIVMYLSMAQLTNRLVGASWKQYLLCQLPGAIIGASVVAVALPITVLLRAARLPSLLVLPCALIAAAVAAAVTGALLPRDWFNVVTFGALDKIMESADKLGRLLRTYLHQHELLYKIALVPFNWYQTIVFFTHVSRQGLWRAMRGSRRSAPGHTCQLEMMWDAPFPPCDGAPELITWLRSHGVKVSEGAHAFYIPPQERLARLIPEIVNFYPPGAGFKALKNFGPPTKIRYMVKGHEGYAFLRRLVGTPRDQVVVANYMYLLGIGPKVWDLTCWRGWNNFYTVFVVDHAGDKHPTTEQCLSFLEGLKRLNADTHLRIAVPDWERGEDFLPPDCHHNLRFSETLCQPKYVDFQNFCLTSPEIWAEDVVSKANGTLRRAGGVTFENDKRGMLDDANIYVVKWRSFILDALSRVSLNLSGRIVLDIGCNSGVTLQASLAAGAAWGFGWDSPEVVALARNLLFSLGTTRFSLSGADLHQKYRLEDDIPERFRARLAEAVVFIHKKVSAPESLRAMPWRVLIYEGDETERLDDAFNLLAPMLTGRVKTIASSYVTGESGLVKPLIALLRVGDGETQNLGVSTSPFTANQDSENIY
ncbi:MAG: oligosaccharide flippase family protein [Blastocatellia bacterium]|nr:oligosaccharide flippase family protein [Blastocatellia bacterium]